MLRNWFTNAINDVVDVRIHVVVADWKFGSVEESIADRTVVWRKERTIGSIQHSCKQEKLNLHVMLMLFATFSATIFLARGEARWDVLNPL